ncbi:MAG: MATE family efflux transporter [Sedimentisphaerales bacterium]|nr:MATE family efflux transporter [Sedimentisphaerales bacterium]
MPDISIPPVQNDADYEASLAYMLKVAAPMIVTTISFTIMQFVDRYMVSLLGTNELAAILPSGFVSFLPGAFAIGSLTSLNTFVSQSLGRGDRKDCSNYFWQSLYMGFMYFLLVLVIMWPAAPWIFKILGQPEEVRGLEVIYLRIILYANLVAVVNWSSNQFFMGIHKPIITMYASVCGQIVNVTFNYLLIFGKFGFPEMGIAGAGWGTFIGMAVAGGINIFVFLGGNINSIFQTRHTLNINPGKMWDLLKVGLPAGFGLMVNVALWGVILFGLVGKFGKEALAATSAVLSYTSLAIMPVVGIGTALTAFVGKMIGKGRKDLTVRQTGMCVRIALIYMTIVGICYFIFRDTMMALWSDEEKVIEIGTRILACAAVYQIFHAVGVIYSGSLRGAGDTVWLAFISAACALLILGIGGLLVTIFLPSLNVVGPWIFATLSIVTVGLANRWRFRSKRWMSIDLFKRRSADVPVQTEPTIE